MTWQNTKVRTDFSAIQNELRSAGLVPGVLLQLQADKHFWILGDKPIQLQKLHDDQGRLVREILKGDTADGLHKVPKDNCLLFLGHTVVDVVLSGDTPPGSRLGNHEYRVLTFLHKKLVLWWWYEAIEDGCDELLTIFKVINHDEGNTAGALEQIDGSD